MKIKSFLRQEHKGTQVILMLILTLIFIIPQVSQQLLNDALPATGDLIHRRAIYLLTNFPNFETPLLVSSHSQFYHYFVSYVNILSVLRCNIAFYGMSIINLLMLPLAGLIILIFARRINAHWALLAPLIFLNNPNLVLPFFGHTDQHLIYIFFALILFILFFLPSQTATKVIAILLIGITLNSSITIWLPLIITVLILERHYPSHRPLLLTIFAFMVYLPFLTPPVAYLAFNDYSGTLKSFPLLIAISLVGLFILTFVNRLMRHYPRTKARLFVYGGTFTALLFFTIARSSGPFSGNIRPELIDAAKAGLQSVNIVHYLFVINLSKGIVGFDIYVPIIILATLLGITALSLAKIRITTPMRVLAIIILIPVALALLRLALLKLSFEYFAKTPLYQLHTGRIISISLYLLPLILTNFFALLKPHITKWVPISVVTALIINITFISLFASQRIYPNWTQQQYQQMIKQSLEQGIGENLSPSEALYACRFYQHCDLKTPNNVQF